jgi:hypothetical protein
MSELRLRYQEPHGHQCLNLTEDLVQKLAGNFERIDHPAGAVVSDTADCIITDRQNAVKDF